MSTHYFIERSRFGKTIYELKDTYLHISGRRFLVGVSMHVELRDISSRTERLCRRFYRPIILGSVVGLVSAGATLAFAFQTVLPSEGVVYFEEFTGIFAAVSLGTAIRWIPRVEVVRFKSILGTTLFDAIREDKYADEFDGFVDHPVDRVVNSKRVHPDNIGEPSQRTNS